MEIPTVLARQSHDIVRTVLANQAAAELARTDLATSLKAAKLHQPASSIYKAVEVARESASVTSFSVDLKLETDLSSEAPPRVNEQTELAETNLIPLEDTEPLLPLAFQADTEVAININLPDSLPDDNTEQLPVTDYGEDLPDQTVPELDGFMVNLPAGGFDFGLEAADGEVLDASITDEIRAVLTQEIIDQAATEVLPHTIQESLVTYLETAEPAQIIALELFIQQIVDTTSRLEDLYRAGDTTSQEVVAIEALLGTWYEELLIVLALPHDEITIRKYVDSLRLVADELPTEDSANQYDEGTHESKFSFAALAYQLLQAIKLKLQFIKLARFVVQAAVA